MRLVVTFACVVMLICFGITPGHGEKRVALVIGNDRYANLSADEQLRKAVNDARAVGDALERLGFDVIRGENLGRQAMIDKFDELTHRIKAGDTVFFFFSGHGVAINGGNFILPTDVPNMTADGQDIRLARAALGETDIVTDLQGRGVRVAIIVLDACRNNPFKRPGGKGVGAERGLVRAEPAQGVFMLYSAGVGQTALDRLNDADSNPNSVFTRVFIPTLSTPGVDLKELAGQVRENVARLATSVQHEQRPAFYDETIGGNIYLAGLPKEGETRSEAERAWAATREMTLKECDRLAASPFDTTRPAGIAGVDFDQISTAQAVPACRAAVAIRSNDPRIAYQLARVLQKAGNVDEAARWYRTAADAGYAAGMANLGNMYENGKGVAKDEAEAVRWFRKAADAGNAVGMQNVGVMYRDGRGVAKDEAEAVRWYRKAADAGNTLGMYSLGNMFRMGTGVAKDEAEAVRWFRKGADAGDADSMYNLGNMYRIGRGVAKDEAEAVRWFRNGADAGDADSMSSLGFMYGVGLGVAKDEAEAVRWYRKAADAGLAPGMRSLGFMYENGTGVAKDRAEAVRWYRKAADAGDKQATAELKRLGLR
jgi:uncharacterized protein